MKKLLLFSAAIAMSAISFGQATLNGNGKSTPKVLGSRPAMESSKMSLGIENTFAKTTGVSDSFYFYTLPFRQQLFDSGVFYIVGSLPADSGAFFGTNVYNMNGFAEWFNSGTYGTDTTREIVGVACRWGGTVQAGSTKTINFRMWGINTTTMTINDSDNYVIETPGAVTYTQSANINTFLMDTAINFTWFTTPQAVTGPFFVGYDLPSFQWGTWGNDTLGLYTTRNGYTWNNGYFDTVQNSNNDIDTLYYAQTCYRIDTVWNDVFASTNLDVHLSIVPIYRFEGSNVWPSNVSGVTKHELTLFGNFPNPATNSTNIKFSLDKTSDVNVVVYDMAGRVIANIQENKLSTGEHLIPVQTANLAAGNYVYMISTSTGAAMGAQFTVTK